MKYSVANCKNFQSLDVLVPNEQKVIHICSTPYCVDRHECNGEIVEIITDVHFELK